MTAGIGVRARTHGGCPTMNAGTQQIVEEAVSAKKKNHSNGDLPTNKAAREITALPFTRAAISLAALLVGRSPFEWFFFLADSASSTICCVPAFIVGHPP